MITIRIVSDFTIHERAVKPAPNQVTCDLIVTRVADETYDALREVAAKVTGEFGVPISVAFDNK